VVWITGVYGWFYNSPLYLVVFGFLDEAFFVAFTPIVVVCPPVVVV